LKRAGFQGDKGLDTRSDVPIEKSETASWAFSIAELSEVFSLPWSGYVRLLVIKDDHAREFYEMEAVRGGWSVRELDRQIKSQFYERSELSKNKAAMLEKGAGVKPADVITAVDAIKGPCVLECLFLKDEYCEGRSLSTRRNQPHHRHIGDEMLGEKVLAGLGENEERGRPR